MRSTFTRRVALLLAIGFAASCAEPFDEASLERIAPPEGIAPAPVSQIDSYAKRFLNGIQQVSFDESREYCGFFVENDGLVTGTAPVEGTPDSCIAGYVPDNAVASYHTHGGYLPEYLNEVPSVYDALSAIDASLDDYVSTPGGRFWRVDGETGTATALCGIGCLRQDRLFQVDPATPLDTVLTLEVLEAL